MTNNWLSLISIPPEELWLEQTLRGNPTMLRQRQKKVKALLDQYRKQLEK
jgi:hypothetical protein